MNQIELSSQKKGAITELLVASYFLSLNCLVSQPLTQDSKYDLIIDYYGKLIKIQVKTARQAPHNENAIIFNCRSTTKNISQCKQRRYTADEIDYFATYWNNKVYLIPVNECSTEKTLCLTPPTQSKQNYAEDYLAERILETL